MILCQGGMILKDYSLKFTKLSEYVLTIVAYPRDRMYTFLMGVSILLKKECHTEMLLNDIDVSRIIVYAKKIGESEL